MKILKIQNNFRINNQVKSCSKAVNIKKDASSKISFAGNLDSSYHIVGIAKPFFMAVVANIEPDNETRNDYLTLASVEDEYSPERALAILNIYGMHKNINEEALHSTSKYQNADKETKTKYDKNSARNALMLASRTVDLCSKKGVAKIDTTNLSIAMNVARAASAYPDMPFFEFSMMCRDLDGNFNPHMAAGIFALTDKTKNYDPIVTGNIVEDYCLTPEYTLDKEALNIAADIYNAWDKYNADEVIDLALNLKKDKMDPDLAKITIEMIKFFDSCDCDLAQAAEEFGVDEEDELEDEMLQEPEFRDDFVESDDIDDYNPEEYQAEDEEFEEDEYVPDESLESIKLDSGYVKMVYKTIQKMINMVTDEETGEVDLAKYEKLFAQIKSQSGSDFNSFVRIIKKY